ncbi:MAG: hypothetical protein ACAI25_15265 [Planctomycetota bacterium]
MAKIKKATKVRVRARKKIAESVGPERGRVRAAASPDEERFILEEAREVREKKHPRTSKERIVAIGVARSRGRTIGAPAKAPHGKSKVRERSANAYHKSTARRDAAR